MQEAPDEDPSISTFDDLLVALECDDVDDIINFLDGLLEPYPSDFEVTPDTSAEDDEHCPPGPGPRLIIDIYHTLDIDTATIELAYPFRLSDFHDAVAWCDDFEWTHNKARESVGSDDDATLNDPDTDDYSESMADWLGVSGDDLRDTLGGPWFLIEGPGQDYYGKRIHGWYAENVEPSTIAIGIGGDALYVQSLAWDGDTPELAEWPQPTVRGPYYDGTIEYTRQHSPVDVLGVLSAALYAVNQPPSPPATKSIGRRPPR